MQGNKKKICYVANNNIAIRFLLQTQLEFLKSQGYEVFVVCSNGEDAKAVEVPKGYFGFKIENINFSRRLVSLSHFTAFLKLFFYFKREKFDVVHTHNPVPGIVGRVAAKLAGVPIIINTIHGFYFSAKTPYIRRKFYIFLEKLASKCSDLIFSQSQEDIETAVKENICPREKLKYLGNGINLEKFNPDKYSAEFIVQKKKSLGIKEDAKVIGIVARRVKEKGYMDLFEACSIVFSQYENVILLAVGHDEPNKSDGFKPEVVRNFGIENKVIFLGERRDVEELYPLMDIFVLPSWREGFPRSVLEAMAEKRPIVATDIRGCREEVESGKDGILVPPANPAELAKAIIFILQNPDEASLMAQSARIRAEKEFDERLIFDRIKEGYDMLINKKA